jgi:hypothetical protein
MRTQEQMRADQDTISRLMKYILSVKKKELGDVMCEMCGGKEDLEVHHNKYGEVNYYDLELLCIRCHRGKYHSKKHTK